jgi:hypothetical protein
VTSNIVTGIVKMDLLKAAISCLDILYWVNKNFKLSHEKIQEKEFQNDAVNNNLELKSSMVEWAKWTKI